MLESSIIVNIPRIVYGSIIKMLAICFEVELDFSAVN